jgi:hypothetical protein
MIRDATGAWQQSALRQARQFREICTLVHECTSDLRAPEARIRSSLRGNFETNPIKC